VLASIVLGIVAFVGDIQLIRYELVAVKELDPRP
jgi:hypothetical protein